MTIPEVMLDDRRFQDLVNECRRRVPKSCPEWTEVNVSDPGMTLIELFAWMCDMLSYRINRLPEKIHVALLELLGVQLSPPRAATAEVRFRLERPPTTSVQIAADTTELATPRTASRESIVFRVSETFVIRPLSLEAYLLIGAERSIEVAVSDGRAQPTASERFAFNTKPQLGDRILLGFGGPLDRLLMHIQVDCRPARGVGIDPHDPPLEWAVSTPGDLWTPLSPLSDTTDGFNKSGGSIELELPASTARQKIGPHNLYWLRCRLDPAASHNALNKIYTHSPEIFNLHAEPVGATVEAEHCQTVEREPLGRSDGTPGQRFKLRQTPVLSPTEEERLEVLDARAGRRVGWTLVESFAHSKEQDLHYTLDETDGTIDLGPAVRKPDGTFRQYGAIPSAGSELRFSGYRHGGGSAGNVAARTLTRLRRPIVGVSSVVNPRAATGGMDGESVDNARARLAIEQRTGQRAITSADIEDLCVAASQRAARACCLPGVDGGPARVYVVPRADRPARRLLLADLTPRDDLIEELKRFLDERRLVGTTLSLDGARYRAVSVVVSARANPSADVAELRRRVLRTLYSYLNPLIGGSTPGPGTGWQFGRALKRGELYPIVEGIGGLAKIDFVRAYETNLKSGEIVGDRLTSDLVLGAEETIASGIHRVRIAPSTPA
jgi:predicted phage baseplate assembly protein